MATIYRCDNCETLSDSLTGWCIISVQFLSNNPTVPTPPGGRTLDYTAPDLLFDTVACRDAWCTKAGVA